MGKAVPKHSTPVGRTHFQIVGAGCGIANIYLRISQSVPRNIIGI